MCKTAINIPRHRSILSPSCSNCSGIFQCCWDLAPTAQPARQGSTQPGAGEGGHPWALMLPWSLPSIRLHQASGGSASNQARAGFLGAEPWVTLGRELTDTKPPERRRAWLNVTGQIWTNTHRFWRCLCLCLIDHFYTLLIFIIDFKVFRIP